MPKYAAKIEYDGSQYVGYQVQPNGHSIQAAIEKALKLMAKLPQGQHIPTASAGRTDAGVHALGQVLHFDYPSRLPETAFRKALNSLLDPSIRVLNVVEVAEDFHCRYMAVSKEYVYRVDLNDYPDPFKRLYTLHHPYKIDIERMQTAIVSILGEHDFTSFCSTKTDKTDLVRTIYAASVDYDSNMNELNFYFKGNGFLYNMVRILVGTLLQIGDGLKPVNELQRLLAVKDRQEAGPTAPPQGLYMVKVNYEQDPFEIEVIDKRV